MSKATFQAGLAAGIVSGMRFPMVVEQVRKTPVAYLYNGVRLPPLPEWDKETYPYAMMTPPMLGGSRLYLLSEWEYYYYHNSISGFSQEGIKYSKGSPTYKASVDGAEWERMPDVVNASQVIFEYILWANTDVVCQSDYYKPAGSIYLAASEPIPVYE